MNILFLFVSLYHLSYVFFAYLGCHVYNFSHPPEECPSLFCFFNFYLLFVFLSEQSFEQPLLEHALVFFGLVVFGLFLLGLARDALLDLEGELALLLLLNLRQFDSFVFFLDPILLFHPVLYFLLGSVVLPSHLFQG